MGLWEVLQQIPVDFGWRHGTPCINQMFITGLTQRDKHAHTLTFTHVTDIITDNRRWFKSLVASGASDVLTEIRRPAEREAYPITDNSRFRCSQSDCMILRYLIYKVKHCGTIKLLISDDVAWLPQCKACCKNLLIADIHDNRHGMLFACENDTKQHTKLLCCPCSCVVQWSKVSLVGCLHSHDVDPSDCTLWYLLVCRVQCLTCYFCQALLSSLTLSSSL